MCKPSPVAIVVLVQRQTWNAVCRDAGAIDFLAKANIDTEKA
jgi:hypothetical protein